VTDLFMGGFCFASIVCFFFLRLHRSLGLFLGDGHAPFLSLILHQNAPSPTNYVFPFSFLGVNFCKTSWGGGGGRSVVVRVYQIPIIMLPKVPSKFYFILFISFIIFYFFAMSQFDWPITQKKKRLWRLLKMKGFILKKGAATIFGMD